MKKEIQELIAGKPKNFFETFLKILDVRKENTLSKMKEGKDKQPLKESVIDALTRGIQSKDKSLEVKFANGRSTDVDPTDAKILINYVKKLGDIGVTTKQTFLNALNKNPASFMICMNKALNEGTETLKEADEDKKGQILDLQKKKNDIDKQIEDIKKTMEGGGEGE